MLKRSTPAWAVSALALLAALAACAQHAPAPPGAPDGNTVRIVDPGGQLRDQEGSIQATLAAALARVTEMLPLTGVTITVTADSRRAIGGYGLGGFTPDGQTVLLYIDPGFPDLARLLPSRLPPALAHEMHHAKRWRGPGYGGTLLEAMVTEGLADHFAIELFGVPVPAWSDAFPGEETARLLELARPEFDSTSYSHARWFRLPSPSWPRWTGYTLGFRLVEAYLARHPEATAAQLVDTPAGAFRPD